MMIAEEDNSWHYLTLAVAITVVDSLSISLRVATDDDAFALRIVHGLIDFVKVSKKRLEEFYAVLDIACSHGFSNRMHA